MLDFYHMASHAKDMEAVKDVAGIPGNEAIVQQASDSMRATFNRIVIDGDQIADKLSDEQKLSVLNCFFEQSGLLEKARMENSRIRSLKLPPASSDSTEEARKTG